MVKNNVPGFCTEVEHAVKILELVKPDLSKNMKVLRRNFKNELLKIQKSRIVKGSSQVNLFSLDEYTID